MVVSGLSAEEQLYQSLGLGPRQEEEKKDSGMIGMETFLELMVTQLKNQDPFEPMENGEFLSQIASFGSVSGLEQLNESFSSLSASLTSNQALQAGSLIGREVLIPASTGELKLGEAVRGMVELDSSTQNLVLNVSDAAGQLIRQVQLGAHGAGPVEFSWDGIDKAGLFAPPGEYRIQVLAGYSDGTEDLQTYLYSHVESVSVGTGYEGLTLNLDNQGSVSFDDVKQIH